MKEKPWISCHEVSKPIYIKNCFRMILCRCGLAQKECHLGHDIWVTDTTLRDGQQSMRSFNSDQSVKIFDFLHKIVNGSGVVRQAEFFVYNENDRKR